MNKKLSEQFDIVMANLKPIEPSAGFEFEFGRRLRDAALTVREEPALIRAAKLFFENVRYNILPQTPALVRVAASFFFVFSIGLYTYGLQPMQPSLVSQGNIMAARIPAGYMVTTGPGEEIDIVLKDRYTVRLKSNSRLKVSKLTPRLWHGTADFKLAEGNILVSVEKGFKGSKFVVDTGAGCATALGTKFSVDVTENKTHRTAVAVAEGRVKVSGNYRPKNMLFAKNTVVVGAGQKTVMSTDHAPIPPERLMQEEWTKLEELYQIGKKPQVMLLLKNAPDRVMQLLKPCPLYISDEKPRDIPLAFDDVVRKIEEALKTGDIAKHLEAIKLLEKLVDKYPNPKYCPQFMLYIGSYYGYIGDYGNAVLSFERMVKKYPESQFASLAQAAAGVIYKENIKDATKAQEAFEKILKFYPNTLEAILVEDKLGISKAS